MSTTTIRLPEELKDRVARLAEQTGTTPHNFMLQAIAEKLEQEEQRADFHATGEQRFSDFLADGKCISWDEMRKYLERRARGETVPSPIPKKFSR